MTPGQWRVFMLICLLIAMEALANPALSSFFKNVVGGFWNLGGA